MEHVVGAADAAAAAWRLHAFELLITLVLAFAFGCLVTSVERHSVLGADEKVEHSQLNCSAAAALKFDCVLEDAKSVIEPDGEAPHRQLPDREYRGSGVRTGGRPWRCVAACSSFARSLNALRSPRLKIHSFGHGKVARGVSRHSPHPFPLR